MIKPYFLIENHIKRNVLTMTDDNENVMKTLKIHFIILLIFQCHIKAFQFCIQIFLFATCRIQT